MHSIFQTNFIGADVSVYSDTSLEKLVSRFQRDLSMEQFAISDFTLVPSNLLSSINGNHVAISSIVELEDSFKNRKVRQFLYPTSWIVSLPVGAL
jgi:hypothetical protein